MALIFKRKAPAPVPVAAPTNAAAPKAAAVPSRPQAKPVIKPVIKPQNLPGIKGVAPVQSIAPKKVSLSPESSKVQEPATSVVVNGVTYSETDQKFPKAPIGTKVKITNEMFPWVKHYRPGDIGTVQSVMQNSDPLGISQDGSHQIHVILIDTPTEPARKNYRAALFRWEFELA